MYKNQVEGQLVVSYFFFSKFSLVSRGRSQVVSPLVDSNSQALKDIRFQNCNPEVR